MLSLVLSLTKIAAIVVVVDGAVLSVFVHESR